MSVADASDEDVVVSEPEVTESKIPAAPDASGEIVG